MTDAGNSNVECGFMSLHLMSSKNSLLFVFVKPKLYCFNHSYALQVSFFSLITNVVATIVTSNFWLCSKFCADKIATSYVFEGYRYLPTIQTYHQSNLWRLTSLQKCPGLLLNAHQMPKEMLEASDFFPALWKSAVFGHVFFEKLLSSASHDVEKIYLWFFSYWFSDQIRTNLHHLKKNSLF